MPKSPPGAAAKRALVRLGTEPSDLVAEVRTLVGAGVRIDEALLDAAMRGWSENTRRAFRSDLTLWGQWCRSRRVQPGATSAVDVAAWIRVLAGTEASDLKTRAMATIERYLVHVGWAYRMAGLSDPTSDPLVRRSGEDEPARRARISETLAGRRAHIGLGDHYESA
jgi:hypothetical protein